MIQYSHFDGHNKEIFPTPGTEPGDYMRAGVRPGTETGKKRDLKIAFYKRFGEQKIDIVCFTDTEDSVFKQLALDEAVRL